LPGGTGGKDGGPTFVVDGSNPGSFSISPPTASLTINPASGSASTVQFTLNGDPMGQDVVWHVTNPAIGGIDSNGLFTATGTAGGNSEIQAVIGGTTVKASVTVTINYEQNGGGTRTDTDAGAGGLGGVGGEGFGGAIDDSLVSVLKGAATSDASLKWLYPYDRTVFPLDILPPLLQWSAGSHGNFDAVYIHLSAGQYFDYKGFYGRPALLGSGENFVRHPIPKDVWKAATLSAAGSKLTVELVLAAGGKAYGPITETYDIALAPINGRIYYQAYATAFVENEPEPTVWGGRFGGATLSIDVGAAAPKLVAGWSNTNGTKEGCRVCHSVSAYGDRMVAQHGEDYTKTSAYDLKNGNAESTPYTDTWAGWAGFYPDGTIAVTNTEDVTGSNSNDPPSRLIDMTTGRAIAPSAGGQGIGAFVTSMALPAFSPDGRHVAFTFVDGPAAGAIGGNKGQQLAVLDFDLATKSFSNPRRLWLGNNGERPAFVTFMPSSDAVVFQKRWGGDNDYSSWHNARSELWWVDLATKTAARLDNVNGIGPDKQRYVPVVGASQHDQDETLNYEPSISPVASGGYAWMVFMSRRLYGNVARSAPWNSDPRDFHTNQPCTPDLGDNPDCYTTKKIWMAAIDLNPKPGTDPSHPAFYIPGQEIKGTNSRPFFALQPCVTDRGTCSTGVDCCSGFCRDGYCSPPPVDQCSQINEKCQTTSDCCADSGGQCIGGFCAILVQ
jgi:hypothetical protein